MKHKVERWVRKGVLLIVFAGILVGFCFAVRELWNWLMPVIFGLPNISVGQALGLLVLSRILLGGFRGWPGHRRRWGHRMRERWDAMTPEEREKFRLGMQRRCGAFGVQKEEPGV
ncbi:MAG: hypothetical protein ABJF23_03980 [Bryobacteraceae bacterium]